MQGSTFGERVFEFYTSLSIPQNIPDDVVTMNPYQDLRTQEYLRVFLQKYFSDKEPCTLVFGINPGRFGGGQTGINFTDPVALEKYCGIKNDLSKKRELSSEFIYQFIEMCGGTKVFYKQFFLSALSPLGFTKNNKNYNYYDDKAILNATTSFIVECIKKQIKFGTNPKSVIIFGSGKNLKIFKQLNKEHKFFKQIYALDHPRFIMQYKRKQIQIYLQKYFETFSFALNK